MTQTILPAAASLITQPWNTRFALQSEAPFCKLYSITVCFMVLNFFFFFFVFLSLGHYWVHFLMLLKSSIQWYPKQQQCRWSMKDRRSACTSPQNTLATIFVKTEVTEARKKSYTYIFCSLSVVNAYQHEYCNTSVPVSAKKFVWNPAGWRSSNFQTSSFLFYFLPHSCLNLMSIQVGQLLQKEKTKELKTSDSGSFEAFSYRCWQYHARILLG